MSETLRVAVRADASARIGTGHIARCLALAEQLRQSGGAVRFIAMPLPAELEDRIRDEGHELATLALGQDWQSDAAQSLASLASGKPWHWLVVDHYGLDARWESRLRLAAPRVMAIDDLADRPHDCDLLLDQNYHGDMERRYDGLLPPHCRKLLGPGHALLRAEFARNRGKARVPAPGIERIFVCFGGIDAGNETSKAIEAIQGTPLRATVDVVIGAGNPHRADVLRACAPDPRFRVHVQPDDLVNLMLQADLAIGAGGTMNWERCALGLPSIVVVTAANQAHVARDLAAAGACVSLGDAAGVSIESLAAAILKLAARQALRQQLRSAALALMPAAAQSVSAQMRELARA